MYKRSSMKEDSILVHEITQELLKPEVEDELAVMLPGF